MNEFYQFYQETIRNTLRPLEAERRSAALKYQQIKLIQIAMFVAFVVLTLVYLFGGISFVKFFIIAIILTYLCLMFSKKGKKLAKEYTNNIKYQILKKALLKWGKFEISKLKISSLAENSLKIAAASTPKSHNLKLISKKHLIGRTDVGELDFILAENIIKNDNKKDNTPELSLKEKVVSFIENFDQRIEDKKIRYIMAVAFYVDNNAPQTRVFLLPKDQNSQICKYYNDVKKVKIKNLNFNEKYDVWTNNPQTAEKGTCNLFFDSLADDQQIYLGNLSAMIEGNKGVVCLEMMYDVCYFGVNDEIDNGGKFADIANIAESLIDIVSRIKKSF